MARTPITDSANVFLQGSQLFQGANSKIFDAINHTADLYQRQQMQRDANLSAERMKQAELDAQKAKFMQEQQKAMFTDEGLQAILAKKQMAPQSVSPEEEAALQAGIQFRQSQMAQNPLTGGLYPKFQLNFNGASNVTSPVSDMMVPSPMPMEPSVSPVAGAMLPPPRLDGEPSTTEQFNNDFKAAPVPIGATEKAISPVDTTGMGSTPVGKMEQWKKELEVAAKRAEFDWNKGKEVQLTEKNQGLLQKTISRMSEINEALKDANVSDEGSIAGNALSMVRGAQIPVPFSGSGIKVGRAGEKILSPKIAGLREEYENLKSLGLQLYKASSGLTAGQMNSEKEQEFALSVFGSPNGNYDANKRTLEQTSKLYGGGQTSEPTKPQSSDIDAKLKAAGYTGAQIEAYKRAKKLK